MKLKRILSLFTAIALLGGLFTTPVFADESSWQLTPTLQSFLNILGQRISIPLPDGSTGWAHFDRGQLVYGFPSDVTPSDQNWKQAPADQYGDDWDTANALDSSQAPSGNTAWVSGLQFTGSHPNQEPRYLGYDAKKIEISNENFPIDASSMPIPAQCVMIAKPWSNVSIDPNYENQTGSGWPGQDASAVPDYAWSVIKGAIQGCYEQFGEPKADSFANNPAFSAGLSPTDIENYFELLTMPEPGITGSIRFWHNDSDGSGPYYKTISIPWVVLPNYYVVPGSLTPFSGTQTSPTSTVNGQTAAVYNTSGAQNVYTGTVTFGLEPDPINSSNAGSIAYQLWQLMSLPNVLQSDEAYSSPVGVCINNTSTFATIKQDDNFQPVPANENAGGPNEGIILIDQNGTPATYTATFTWSLPQGFSGTSMPIAAGINDGFNDWSNQTTDIIPSDITMLYSDLYEIDLSDNFTNVLSLSGTSGTSGSGTTGTGGTNGSTGTSGTGGNTATSVPVVGATQPQLIVTPASATINVGSTQAYIDTYYPSGQSQGGGQVVTVESSWMDDNGSIASIGNHTGLATGSAPGNTNISDTYTPLGGSPLNGNAALTVQAAQQTGGTNGSNGSNSGDATLTFQAVNQTNIENFYGTQIGGTLHRGANIALWTDTVTATLSAPAPQPPQPELSGNEQLVSGPTVTSWAITDATLNDIPAQNPDYAFGNPVEPVSYLPAMTMTSQGSASSGNATAATPGFEENWSEDGIGYGTSGPYGIKDILTGQMMATTPESYQMLATYTVTYGYTYTVHIPGSGNDDPGYDQTLNGSGSTGPLTVTHDLWVCGTGAVPMTSAGKNYMAADTLNPQTHQ